MCYAASVQHRSKPGKSCRLYGSHAATWATVDPTDEKSICPESLDHDLWEAIIQIMICRRRESVCKSSNSIVIPRSCPRPSYTLQFQHKISRIPAPRPAMLRVPRAVQY